MTTATRKNRPWTREEDSRLLYYVGFEPPASIAARLGRTAGGIIRRYTRRQHGRGGLFMRAASRAGGLSISECMHAMGVSRQRVFYWVHRGWLKGQRHYVITDYVYAIEQDELGRFIATAGGLLPRLEPSPEWRDVVERAERELRARYINRSEIASMLDVSLDYLVRLPAFPAPALRLTCYWYERAAVRAWLVEQAPAHYRTLRALRAFGLEG